MKVRVKFEMAGQGIDETITGANADAILVDAKARVERALGWKGLFVKALTPMQFAQEAVKRLNAEMGTNYASPQNADDFLKLGKDLGFATMVEE